MRPSRSLIFVLLWFLPVAVLSSTPTTLNFSLLVFNGEQRTAYFDQVKRFESLYPHIRVNMQALESERYKASIEDWLKAEAHSDVMYWFGGERLNWYISQGWVQPIDELWQRFDWDQRIEASAKSAVRHGGVTYGLPVHYYHWGIYYKKSLFNELGLQVPADWEEFLAVCRRLQDAGVAPIALGSKEHWPAAGWFDYLNLRINGLPLHQDLSQGRIAYSSPKITRVFEHWRQLLDRGYFLENHGEIAWQQALPYLYRDMAGVMLMGNFWTSQIPDSLRADIGVFRFPILDPEMAVYEEAPTNVLFVPANVQEPEAAALFMDFMAREEVQAALNEATGMIAPQRHTTQHMDHLVAAGERLLSQAQGVSQFYDRDNPKPIAIGGMQLMSRFLSNPDTLPEVLRALDALRLDSFHTSSLAAE